MYIENEATFRKAISNGFNLFTGAGFSVLAKDKDGKSLPVASTLTDELIDHFNRPELESLELDELSEVLKDGHKDNFRRYIFNRYTVSEFNDLYYNITKKGINIKNIFTTNVDDLLYNIFSGHVHLYLNDTDLRGSSYSNKDAINLYTFHGNVRKPDQSLSFSQTEVATSFDSDPDSWYTLVSRMELQPTLFWGHSLSSPGILKALSPIKNDNRSFDDVWTTVHPDVDEATREVYRSYNFQLIEATTRELLEYFDTIGQEYPSVDTSQTTSELFPEEAIPKSSEVAPRRIEEFYLGAPPVWWDIFDNKIYRTHHFDKVRNILNKTDDIILTGIVGCGKTTLLMQVAHNFDFRGHKLAVYGPSLEKARQITRKLDGDDGLIFVDDFTNDIEAFIHFLEETNVQVVGADREYRVSTIQHKISQYNVNNNIRNITTLRDKDIQEILNRIPVEIKERHAKKPSIKGNRKPSVFELVEKNISKIDLGDRFRKAMVDMESRRPQLLEFLLMTSYVHKCRTPVSLDMLLAYFRNEISDYNEVYKMRDDISEMIADYIGRFNDTDQDYFVARSTLVAERIIKQSPYSFLKKVIKKFHSKLSPLRIHRYDVFCRSSYRYKLMKKVFPDWKEGRDFYYHIYNTRDDSPYVLQQGALYLREKKRYSESFSMIDKALDIAGEQNTSILNSYARIYFDANFRHDDQDGKVKRRLLDSMSILKDCYRRDRRKEHHVTSYAHRALKLLDKYSLGVAENHLQRAYTWLKEEHRKELAGRQVIRLYNKYRKRMQSLFPNRY